VGAREPSQWKIFFLDRSAGANLADHLL